MFPKTPEIGHKYFVLAVEKPNVLYLGILVFEVSHPNSSKLTLKVFWKSVHIFLYPIAPKIVVVDPPTS